MARSVLRPRPMRPDFTPDHWPLEIPSALANSRSDAPERSCFPRRCLIRSFALRVIVSMCNILHNPKPFVKYLTHQFPANFADSLSDCTTAVYNHAQDTPEGVGVQMADEPRELDVGGRVSTLRQQRKWSLRKLAEKAGVSYGWIGLLERGDVKTPSAAMLSKLASAFGISLEELLRGEGDSSLSGGERGLALYSERDQEMIRTILTSIQSISPYVEDIPGLLEMWAALPPALMIAVADIIHVEYLRNQLADSGKVTRAQPGHRRTKEVPFTPWDMLAPKPGRAKILGATEEELSNDGTQKEA